jgi:hypothetical protein
MHRLESKNKKKIAGALNKGEIKWQFQKNEHQNQKKIYEKPFGKRKL